MVALPSQLNMDVLQYPAMSKFGDINYHHLCVTWSKFAHITIFGDKAGFFPL